jgi:hypothetical protein
MMNGIEALINHQVFIVSSASVTGIDQRLGRIIAVINAIRLMETACVLSPALVSLLFMLDLSDGKRLALY